ncbi:type I restriction endonuclease subunit R [Falsiroseomonas algicola]|nr:DEAD/DEAH box helicase family protein [Falsiroseomonas algicola]
MQHADAPERRSRRVIDAALAAAGWIVQDRAEVNLHAGPGVIVRETPTATGAADYLLFLDGRACGVLEAKPEGTTLSGVVPQGTGYARAAPSGYPAWASPLPFVNVSTGTETLFHDTRDPQARPRSVFAPHRPEKLRAMIAAGGSLRARLVTLPPLDPTRLRPCQAEAIAGVEASLAQGRPRALVSMATGAGKTYTACALTHRLLSPPVRMGRVLFLVDRANLGTQAKREFDGFVPSGAPGGAGLLFREEFTVQHLQGSTIDPSASVVISTVQRLYSVLRGQPFDDADDERGGFERAADDAERPVTYNPAIPPETFDLIVVDECHRSIYGNWRQVLEYFDAFLVGLTATPGRHTLGFFQQNLVSQYPFERSVADGVNVDFEVWRVRTEVGERGGTIPAGFTVPHRDKATRRRRLAALDEDMPYTPGQLNRAVEVPNQIRTVLQAYRDALPTQLFPGRQEVPKTLIFCQSDSHAETVTEIAREVFGGDARFAQKITYRATGRSGQELIQDFRTDHLFRIATTVDMVATGTDIKPLEVVIFLRDVRSAQYFEQMRGRGARTILPTDLQRATPSAERKDRFIIVDAVGVTESVKTPTEPLERDRTLSLEALLERVAFGHTDEDTCATLAGRLARLERRLPDPARAELTQAAAGATLIHLARALVDAADPVRIEARAREAGAATPDDEAAWDDAAAALRAEACRPLAANPALRRAILEAQRQTEIIVDELTADAVLSADFDLNRATEITERFGRFLAEEADKLAALAILYARSHSQRRLTYAMLQELRAAMARPPWLLDDKAVWACYRRLHAGQTRAPTGLLTDLVGLVRYAIGARAVLAPFAPDVNRNFELWLGREKKAGRDYTEAQMEWLRPMKDWVASNVELTLADLREASDFSSRGGTARARALFGAERLPSLVDDLTDALVA